MERSSSGPVNYLIACSALGAHSELREAQRRLGLLIVFHISLLYIVLTLTFKEVEQHK